MRHDVRVFRLGTATESYRCDTPRCVESHTLVRQPEDSDESWAEKTEKYIKKHPCNRILNKPVDLVPA